MITGIIFFLPPYSVPFLILSFLPFLKLPLLLLLLSHPSSLSFSLSTNHFPLLWHPSSLTHIPLLLLSLLRPFFAHITSLLLSQLLFFLFPFPQFILRPHSISPSLTLLLFPFLPFLRLFFAHIISLLLSQLLLILLFPFLGPFFAHITSLLITHSPLSLPPFSQTNLPSCSHTPFFSFSLFSDRNFPFSLPSLSLTLIPFLPFLRP